MENLYDTDKNMPEDGSGRFSEEIEWTCEKCGIQIDMNTAIRSFQQTDQILCYDHYVDALF